MGWWWLITVGCWFWFVRICGIWWGKLLWWLITVWLIVVGLGTWRTGLGIVMTFWAKDGANVAVIDWIIGFLFGEIVIVGANYPSFWDYIVMWMLWEDELLLLFWSLVWVIVPLYWLFLLIDSTFAIFLGSWGAYGVSMKFEVLLIWLPFCV